jgi:hypothetical protein
MTAVSTTDENGVVGGSKDDQKVPRPWKYEFRSSKAFIIAVVSIAIFAVSINAGPLPSDLRN